MVGAGPVRHDLERQMFLHEDFLYVDLNKTGTVAVEKALGTLGFKPQKYKHHGKPTKADVQSRKVFATIRDPWSFYLSLWAYGVTHATLSGPYTRLTKFNPLGGRGGSINRGAAALSIPTYLAQSLSYDWKTAHERLYGAMEVERFRNWLPIILDPKRATFISGVFSQSGMVRHSGLLTYRYCKLLCFDSATLHSRKLATLDALKAWEEEQCYVDHFVQTANLMPDLIDTLARIGAIGDAEAALTQVGATRSNSTLSSESKLATYYTPELVAAVAERERFLIDKFHYPAPM